MAHAEALYECSVLPWDITSKSRNSYLLAPILDFSSSVVWEACVKVTGSDALRLVDTLKHLNFAELHGQDDRFAKFLVWLYSLVSPRVIYPGLYRILNSRNTYSGAPESASRSS